MSVGQLPTITLTREQILSIASNAHVIALWLHHLYRS